VIVLFIDYIRLQWSGILNLIGDYYKTFTPVNVHGKFVFAPLSLLGGCMLPLEFLYFSTKGYITTRDYFFATCGVTFLTIGDTFVLSLNT
jgi:hypothetical protein